MEDNFLFMRLRVRQHTCAADFRPGSCRGRYRDDRGNFVCIGTGPPVTHVFEVPDGTRLSAHEGNDLTEIESRSATKGNYAVMTTLVVSRDTGCKIVFVGIRVDIDEYCATQAGSLENG